MSHIESDQSVREAVLDPTESFIVQAPAGSGKTELLTQRFLTLLARVDTPEEIIAITFTRKAAQEMQHRIMHALHRAAKHQEPSQAHELITYQLATKALEHDKKQQWELRDTPSRLRILTLDALSAMIDQQSPIATKFGAKPEVSDNADELYEKAITALLMDVSNETLTKTVNTFLLYCHNNVPLLTRLLKQLLATREQWLTHVMPYFRDPSAMKEHFEIAREKDKEKLIHRIQTTIPFSIASELMLLIPFAAEQLSTLNPESLAVQAASENADSDHFLFWQAAAELMLTKKREWRRSVTKKQGFPAASSAEKHLKETFTNNKARMLALIASCRENSIYLDRLIDAQVFPTTSYDDAHWEQLQALTQLLPYLVAQLKVCFQETGKVDFNELTIGAIRALYANGEPTYLALKLDYQIKHLLVDECQDTSNLQHELLTHLIDGWAPGDNRTLFLVGDPMQSIYRFRNANVSHFLRTQTDGINNVTPKAMCLTRNFRSVPAVIDWINHAFTSAFSETNDPQSGAVAYSPSLATKQNTEDTLGVHHYPIDTQTPEQEAETIKQIVLSIQENEPKASIALLVRARHQLDAIVPVLQAAGIQYHANNIDSLTTNPDIQDLMSITRAFSHLNDRVAWISLLRSPWFSLSLDDLLILCDNKYTSIYTNLCSDTLPLSLSIEGQQRLQILKPVLTHIMNHVNRSPLHEWVRKAWYALGGPTTLTDPKQRHHINRFFDELSLIDTIDDINVFTERFSKLYAEDTCQSSTLSIMTIHKSKGLEFDHVIIPGIHRANRRFDQPMLRWANIHDHDNGEHLLLACRTTNPSDSMYEYLGHLDKQQLEHELTRLFYVACTRAKQSLHLSYHTDTPKDQETTHENARSGSFLKLLSNDSWSFSICHHHKNDFANSDKRELIIDASSVCFPVLSDYLKGITPRAVTQESPDSTPIDRIAQACGNSLHAWLAYSVEQGFMQKPFDKDFTVNWLHSFLAHQGIGKHERDHLAKHLTNTYALMRNESIGAWILDSTHAHSHAELELSVSGKERQHQLIIDRCFIDDGKLWIIDYKTSSAVPENKGEALARHQQQLSHYAYAMSQIRSEPISLGVYYTEQQRWFSWEYSSSAIIPANV